MFICGLFIALVFFRKLLELSKLIEECVSEVVFLCHPISNLHPNFWLGRSGGPRVPSDASENHGTEADTRQAIEAAANPGEALRAAPHCGCGNWRSRRRGAVPIHMYAAITGERPVSVASCHRPARLGGRSKRGPARSIRNQVDGLPTVRL